MRDFRGRVAVVTLDRWETEPSTLRERAAKLARGQCPIELQQLGLS